ncbi:MAG: DUF4430 domain-containing protein [Candidatus Thermoplasmatota archaeon]
MGLYNIYNKKRRNTWLFILIILVLLVLTVIVSKSIFTIIDTTVSEDRVNCRVIITLDYGKSLILDSMVTNNKQLSAFDALESVASIDSTGGFVNSINGISSTYSLVNNEPKDWFYYINGMLSPVGSKSYIVHDGDIIHWDYHLWFDYKSSTAIIGDYPEPFLHGFNGNQPGNFIVYTLDSKGNAERIHQVLSSRYNISSSLIPVDNLTSDIKSRGNLILIGVLDVHPLIREVMSLSQELGLFIRYDNGSMIVLDELYRINDYFDHGGCILALQNYWNPKGSINGENVIWIISGITSIDVDNACDILCYHPERIRYANSVVVVDNKVLEVP